MARRASAVAVGPTARDDGNATNARPDDGTDEPTDLRTALRRATTELHRVLDRAPEQRALLARDLTMARYTAIMSKHYRALAVCEATLAALDAEGPKGVPPYRPRLEALAADLAAIGTAQRSVTGSSAVGASTTERAPTMDPAEVRGRYLGTRYVLEGSTQGAAFIARRLEHHLPELGARAFGYWRLQAEEAPAWAALAGELATLPARGPLATAAIAAAHDAFVEFLHAFDLAAPEAVRRRMPEDAPIGDRP